MILLIFRFTETFGTAGIDGYFLKRGELYTSINCVARFGARLSESAHGISGTSNRVSDRENGPRYSASIDNKPSLESNSSSANSAEFLSVLSGKAFFH